MNLYLWCNYTSKWSSPYCPEIRFKQGPKSKWLGVNGLSSILPPKIWLNGWLLKIHCICTKAVNISFYCSTEHRKIFLNILLLTYWGIQTSHLPRLFPLNLKCSLYLYYYKCLFFFFRFELNFIARNNKTWCSILIKKSW